MHLMVLQVHITPTRVCRDPTHEMLDSKQATLPVYVYTYTHGITISALAQRFIVANYLLYQVVNKEI